MQLKRKHNKVRKKSDEKVNKWFNMIKKVTIISDKHEAFSIDSNHISGLADLY